MDVWDAPGNRDRSHKTPQLLVSVRNVAEAASAVDGGCQILDVKEPTRGPLGMATSAELGRIAAWLAAAGKQGLIGSCALGEVQDWLDSRSGESLQRDKLTVPSIPAGYAYWKLGLSGWDDPAEGIEWWARLCEAMSTSYPKSQGIAVAYADWRACSAPSPEQVLNAASTHHAAGVLVDTAVKSSGRLLDHLSVAELTDLSQRAQNAGLLFGVAGRLQMDDLRELVTVRPDIVGIRSAACVGSDRLCSVDTDCVREFRRKLTALFGDAMRASAGCPPTERHSVAVSSGRDVGNRGRDTGIDPADVGNSR